MQSIESTMRRGLERRLGRWLNLFVARTRLLHKSMADSSMVDFISVMLFINGRLLLMILGMFGCTEKVVSWGLVGRNEELEEFFQKT